MALTTAQIEYIRDNAGDFQDADPEVSSASIQVIYDDPEQGNGSLNKTIVWLLRRLVGKTARHITKSDSEGRTEQLEQLHEHYKELLAYWETLTGMSGGLTIGRSVTRAYRADSLQTSEPDYSNGTAGEDDSSYITIYVGG